MDHGWHLQSVSPSWIRILQVRGKMTTLVAKEERIRYQEDEDEAVGETADDEEVVSRPPVQW